MSQYSRFAFITYVNPEHRFEAIEKLNGTVVDDHALRVEESRRSGGYSKTPGQCMSSLLISSHTICFRSDMSQIWVLHAPRDIAETRPEETSAVALQICAAGIRTVAATMAGDIVLGPDPDLAIEAIPRDIHPGDLHMPA